VEKLFTWLVIGKEIYCTENVERNVKKEMLKR